MRPAACGAAVAAALAVLLTSCGGGSPRAKGPSPLPITTHPAGSTASGTPTPTLDPNSDAAILAAVDGYVAAFQDAGRTGDPSQFFALTTPECNCRVGVQELVDKIKNAHVHTNVELAATDKQIVGRSGRHVEVKFTISNGPYHAYDASGNVVGDAAAAQQAVDVNFELQGQRWVAYLNA